MPWWIGQRIKFPMFRLHSTILVSRIVLTQGLNRQIRRMCEFLGYEVVTLKRVRIMNIDLTGLRSGQWRNLTDKEMSIINRSIEGSGKTEELSVDPNKNKNFKKPVKKQFNEPEQTVQEAFRVVKKGTLSLNRKK